ncbi:MAG: TonB-dependent receptor plug domain-containing protein [Segetibacter sp.]
MRKIVSFLTLLMITTLAMSQIRPITGRVLDQAGQPVSGASITIRGSKTGAAADANGDFSINAKNGDVLVVSSVGIPSQEVRVGSSGNVTVTMTRQGQNLSEVVVTALGIRRNRNQVAYSAQQVGGEEVSKTRGGNFINNLSGKVSGLEIRQNNTMGGSTNVVLRGYKSLTGNNQALFVIDGVPIDNANNNTTDQVTGRGGFDYGNAAADINPDNIESMTVLKGPAATALYGSRGNNGVILINTKKGKRGLGITINSGIIRNSIIRSTFPKYQTKYGGGYGQVFRQFDVDGDGTPDDVVRHGDDASWGPKFEGQMVYTWESFDESNANFGKKVPWVAAQNDPSSFLKNLFPSITVCFWKQEMKKDHWL